MFLRPNAAGAVLLTPLVEEISELPECHAIDPLSGAKCSRRHKDTSHRDDDVRGGCQTVISWVAP